MTAFLLVAIFIFASLSLVSYVYCWADIKSGRPHILSLRQITNIMDRNRLNELFGKPEPGFFYKLSPEMLAKLIRMRQPFFLRECATDIVCIYGAWRFMTSEAPLLLLWLFVVLAMLCQAVNLLYSLILVKKWGGQIREEIDNSED